MPSQRGFTSEAGSKGDRDPNILVSSDGLKLSMLVIVKKVLALSYGMLRQSFSKGSLIGNEPHPPLTIVL